MANPKKPPQIEAILRRNKDKLLVFLRNFHTDRDDEQFNVRLSIARVSRLNTLETDTEFSFFPLPPRTGREGFLVATDRGALVAFEGSVTKPQRKRPFCLLVT